MNTKAFVALGVLMVMLLNPFRVSAGEFSTAANLPAAQSGANSVSVSFAQLGYADSELAGPFDTTRRIFSMPPNWQLKPDSTVTLEYDLIFSGADAYLIEDRAGSFAGTLTLSFNNKIIGYIRLDTRGSHSQSFPIPAEAVVSIRESGQHELNITLNAQSDCIYDIRTVVVIKAVSTFDLLFDVTAPQLNLARLPAPFYLRNSLLPDRTLVVVPDEPSAAELQAAMNVMTGFGSMVQRVLDFHLTLFSQLTPEETASSHLIFVGTPERFPLLDTIAFPLPVASGKFSGLPPESAADGIVQLAHSPWNDSKVVLLVSGTSGEAVNKAAQAVASGKIFVYQNPALAYVREVALLAGNVPIVEDFTLQELGYDTQTISGIGIDQIDYTFFVSKEQLPTREGLLNLVYYHSGLVDYGLSSLSVDLNGQVIASKPFTAESEQITTLTIKLPPGLLRFGENQLTVRAKMQPDLSCDFSGFSEPWLVISNQTSMHIPIASPQQFGAAFLLDLKNYPNMFMTHSNLSDVAFVLARNDPAGWNAAASLAYHLGARAAPPIPDVSVVYADEVKETIRSSSSLILVGKASSLPFLDEFNDVLPAPFDYETNTAAEKGMQIIYRLPQGVSVGYLELIASPYNREKLILLLAGNTDEGVAMSVAALIADRLRDQLTGAFAITNGTQVAVGENVSNFSVVGTLVPGSDMVVATPLPASPSVPATLETPAWLPPLFIVSGVAVLSIVSYIVALALRRNRSANLSLEEADKSGE